MTKKRKVGLISTVKRFYDTSNSLQMFLRIKNI